MRQIVGYVSKLTKSSQRIPIVQDSERRLENFYGIHLLYKPEKSQTIMTILKSLLGFYNLF